MIRILHIVHTMECGGIETMLMNLYRNIDRNKIQFDFLVNGSKDNFFTEEILKLGGRVYGITPKHISFRRNIVDMISVMRNKKYQIVHIHQDSMIAVAVYCAKRVGIKYIFTHAHTTSDIGWYRKTLAILGRKYIRKNAYIKFACSDAAASWIYGKSCITYQLFRNSIDANKFRFSEKKRNFSREELGLENKFVLGTCGRLSPEKNQIFLVNVLYEIRKTNKNVILILVGDGVELNKIEKKAKELDVLDSIIFTGLKSNVEFYYNAFDCFLLPSLYEGLPLAGIEAQAAGLTSIFSTGVTDEIKITENVHFIDLSCGARKWAELIMDVNSSPKDTFESIRNFGYDIKNNADRLQQEYINCYKL